MGVVDWGVERVETARLLVLFLYTLYRSVPMVTISIYFYVYN